MASNILLRQIMRSSITIRTVDGGRLQVAAVSIQWDKWVMSEPPPVAIRGRMRGGQRLGDYLDVVELLLILSHWVVRERVWAGPSVLSVMHAFWACGTRCCWRMERLLLVRESVNSRSCSSSLYVGSCVLYLEKKSELKNRIQMIPHDIFSKSPLHGQTPHSVARP